MPEVQVVLVNPLYEGNVGSTARVMKNFGWTRLALVDPCPLGNEAKAMASHAQDVLANARTVTLEEVVHESALVVATTGEVAQSVCSPVRMPYFSPRELRELVADVDGTVSVLFGRENRGLTNEELGRAGVICTHPDLADLPDPEPLARGRDRLLRARRARARHVLAREPLRDGVPLRPPGEFLERVDQPEHKRPVTLLLARRVLSRAKPDHPRGLDHPRPPPPDRAAPRRRHAAKR